MKKVLSIVLAIAMIATMSAVAFAADVTSVTENNSASFDVNGKYTAVADTDNYKIVITWSETEFVYKDAGTHWDVDTHKWVEDTAAVWEGEGTITVANHSSKPVTATATYAPVEGGNTAMTFTGNGAALEACPETQGETTSTAPSATIGAKISAGTINNVEAAKIGTITVAIV